VAAGSGVSLPEVVREWGRIGCVGFGGPPAHIALLRELCVERRGWLTAQRFEDAIGACNLLPGPASTQLAIFCAWTVRGAAGALLGGLAFILPGLVLIIALAAVFLGDPPDVVRGAGEGAGAAVAAVAVQAGLALAGPSWRAAAEGGRRWRWAVYVLAGGVAAALTGPFVVAVLVAAGLLEVAARRSGLVTAAGLDALVWTAFKVGALAYGGGFVIIPLMQADAVETYRWMTDGEFLNAVALGQVTPGPVVHTVAVVGYAAGGVGGALLAALVAFGPSFAFILLGASRFEALRAQRDVRAFLDGAGPAAVGAILGAAIPLALALDEPWQVAVLAAAAVALLALRRGIVETLLAAAAAGAVVALV
jgi:chromate transporter